MILAKVGIPFDTALRLPDEFRLGFCIIAGELEGNQFDWTMMRFKQEPST
jgi:hypothetical protein